MEIRKQIKDKEFCKLGQIHLSAYGEDSIKITTCCGMFSHNHFKIIKLKDLLESDDIIKFLEKEADFIIKGERPNFCACGKTLCNFDISLTGIKRLFVSISQACNLNCIHCFMGKEHSTKYDDIYFKVLNKLAEKEYNLDSVTLTNNGEPFFHVEKTMEFLRKINKKITKKIEITTNGTLLNKKIIDEICDIREKTGVDIVFSVSVDAATEETYKIIRGNRNFKKVIENIAYLKEKNFYVESNFVKMKENKDEINSFKELLHGKISFIRVSRRSV